MIERFYNYWINNKQMQYKKPFFITKIAYYLSNNYFVLVFLTRSGAKLDGENNKTTTIRLNSIFNIVALLVFIIIVLENCNVNNAFEFK